MCRAAPLLHSLADALGPGAQRLTRNGQRKCVAAMHARFRDMAERGGTYFSESSVRV